MKKSNRRKYTSHFKRLKPEYEKLLIRHAREEWQEAERARKKHEIVQKAKITGTEVGRWILGLALAGGVLMVAAAAPNVFCAIGKMSGKQRRHYASLPSSNFDRHLQQGSSKKYWQYAKAASGAYRIELTKKGRAVALRAEMRKFKLHTQPAWDGKWRMAMFDVPKKYSATRDTLRRKLHEIGMHSIQESIFVYPHACIEEVMMWVELFGMGKYVETAEATVSSGLNDQLKKVFEIK